MRNKELGLRLFRVYAHYATFDWFHGEVIVELELFTRYTASDDCSEIVSSVISTLRGVWDRATIFKRFLIKLEMALLIRNQTSYNGPLERFVYRQMVNLLFTLTPNSMEEFSSKMTAIGDSAFHSFVEILLLRDQRRLIESAQLMPLAIGHLEALSVENLHSVVKMLCCSSLLTDFHFYSMTQVCRQLLKMLRDRFISHNLQNVPINNFVDWFKLFAFIDEKDSLQQLVDKICRRSTSGIIDNFAKKLLEMEEVRSNPKLNTLRELLDSNLQEQDRKVSVTRKVSVKRPSRNAEEEESPLNDNFNTTNPSVTKKARIEEYSAQPPEPLLKVVSEEDLCKPVKYGCVIF